MDELDRDKALKGQTAMRRRATWFAALGLTALDVGAWFVWRPLGLILFGLECVAGGMAYWWVAGEFGKIARGEPSEVGRQALKELNLRKSMKEEQ